MAEAEPNPSGDPDAAVEGGNYEVIRGRLLAQAKTLKGQIDALNAKRKAVFGSTDLSVLANGRVRTEHNCVPRDIIQVEGHLLLGFNVTLGLKQEMHVQDVLTLHRFQDGGDYDFSHVPPSEGGQFLTDPGFEKDFADIYRYYRGAQLDQLRVVDRKLLAVFRIGESQHDIKVCRWQIDTSGKLSYIDNRGDRDHVFPASHDFDWVPATREMQVGGAHPHINILDTVFVETVGGDLTIKVENNTEDGRGIWSEPVEDTNQTLDDAEFAYARLGTLILLRIRPYRETVDRYLVFNTRTHDVQRIDAIGKACRQLPEDHGIIFPGGYYLQNGESKVFDGEDFTGLQFKRAVKSPNGEDVLYVFYRPGDGHYALLPYNLINKAVQSPIHCHGYSLFGDGRMVVFRSTSDEPTRVHPMQVWKTPFMSQEFAASAPTDESFLGKVGNAALVRGISDGFAIARHVEHTTPSRVAFEDLIASIGRMRDGYYWLDNPEVGVADTLAEINRTAELIVDEFEKVVAFKAKAADELAACEARQAEVIGQLRPEDQRSVDAFMEKLTAIRQLRGHLITVREVRYIDTARLDELEAEAVEAFDQVARWCVDFLLGEEALAPLHGDIEKLLGDIEQTDTVAEINPLRERLEALSEGLDLLTEVVSGLQIEDATARTRILEDISEVFGQLNRVRATLENRRKSMMGAEGRAEFGAQFKLFGQSVASALALCDTPERCDAELSRLMVALQELEGRFSEFDEFLADLASKRDEVYEAFSTRKQTLLDERNRRVGNILKAVDRILEGVTRRAGSFKDEDELNAWFAADAMVLKLRQFADQLTDLGDTVKADEVLARLKTARQNALRGLRDKRDLFEGGDNLIKLGSHRFSVNTQELALTIVPRDDRMMLHLAGTDFYEPVTDEAFLATREYWDQTVVSETAAVYRAEYLAATLLFEAERAGTVEALVQAQRDEALLATVREAASARYEEGYERGLHDQDAALILDKLLTMREAAGLLRFGPMPRALAALFWGTREEGFRKRWQRRAASAGRLRTSLGQGRAMVELATEAAAAIGAFVDEAKLSLGEHVERAGSYLIEELAAERPRFTTSREAVLLRDALTQHLDRKNLRREFDEDLRALSLGDRLALCQAWVEAYAAQDDDHVSDAELVFETTVLIAGDAVDREPSSAVTRAKVKGLLGQHRRVVDGVMELRLDEFLGRLERFIRVRVPGFRAYRAARAALMEQATEDLRLSEFQPRVMSSFVRNKLINDVYLQIIGDNLAKQMGAAGDAKRTDLMGLLLLVSPPGYGKTTLMEYVANRLGLVFVKVNGPALGHSVHSLDPAEAPNATARQEVEKINLAFEMGNNVMLYLDDIQHTHPELLQKFISLCDGQRRVEGVWRGRTRTYDLRGKKFCVIMAGNPYTESGDKFVIPDMLANRADTYNLGDILEGRDEVFALSYIENSLTSNATLAPLATRDSEDVYRFIRMAQGEEVPTSDLKHGYSAVEINEIVAVLERMIMVQEVVLRVNQQYIVSASQDDAFRTEPSFKLQGSYRNMNKLAEKVVAALNEEEVQSLLDDHYNGESQTLTTGAEHNLLKLAEMRGRLTEDQAARWAEIKKGFQRQKAMGGAEDDPVVRVTGVLTDLNQQVEGIAAALASGSGTAEAMGGVAASLGGIEKALQGRSDDSLRHIASGLVGIRGELGKAKPVELGEVSAKLDAIATVLAQRPAAAAPARKVTIGDNDGSAPSSSTLDRLTAALERIGNPKVEVSVNTPKAVEELLGQQVQIVERTLVPMVQESVKNLKDAQALRIHLAKIVELLKEIDARLHG